MLHLTRKTLFQNSIRDGAAQPKYLIWQLGVFLTREKAAETTASFFASVLTSATAPVSSRKAEKVKKKTPQKPRKTLTLI